MRDRSPTFLAFLTTNRRWLTGGVLLTFASSAGQTFFISLFAGDIRSEFELSHGDFGLVYMLATLASAATLIWLGRFADSVSVAKLAALCIVALAGAAFLMAAARNLMFLVLALYFLRLFGQGMLTHTALVAMGRWFHVERGRAVSVATTGHQLGEGLLPLLVVTALVYVEWRSLWIISAVLLVLLALPMARVCLSQPRTPSASDMQQFESGRQWSRSEVLADPPFWLVCTGVLAPAFIGTSVFFHQVHLAELKAWGPTVIASSFAVLSVCSVLMGLLAGQLIDRFSARAMLPVFLLPLGLGCALLGSFATPLIMPLFMFLLGMSYGVSSAVFGAIWPEVYGTRHLGSVRAVVSAAMVFASALGPGLTGWLIDIGVGFETQLRFMSGYCLFMMMILIPVSRSLVRRARTLATA